MLIIALHCDPTLEEISRSTWSAFAADVGVGEPFVRRRVRTLADSIQVTVFQVVDQLSAAGLSVDALTKFASLIASRSTRLTKTI